MLPGSPGCPNAATGWPFSSRITALDSLAVISSASRASNCFASPASKGPLKTVLPSATIITLTVLLVCTFSASGSDAAAEFAAGLCAFETEAVLVPSAVAELPSPDGAPGAAPDIGASVGDDLLWKCAG